MMAVHLAYPILLIRKEKVTKEVYFNLKKAQVSLKEAAHLRKKLGSFLKEDYDEFIKEFIQAKKEGNNSKQNGLGKKKNEKEIEIKRMKRQCTVNTFWARWDGHSNMCTPKVLMENERA